MALCVMKRIVLVPFVVLYPWESRPSLWQNSFSHTFAVTGLFTIFVYFVIVSLVIGCTTALYIGMFEDWTVGVVWCMLNKVLARWRCDWRGRVFAGSSSS